MNILTEVRIKKIKIKKKGHILKNTQEHNIRTELLYFLEAVTSEILYKSTEKW